MIQLQGTVEDEDRVDEEDRADEEGRADEEDRALEEEEEGVGEHFKDTELEPLGGDREGTTWLVINGVHICYMRKDRGSKKTTAWECAGRRRLGCQFKIRTTNSEGPEALSIITMSDPEIHTCSADKVAPLMQKFRLRLSTRMTEDLDVGWSKIWTEERSRLLGSLKDHPELNQQVMLEMSDVEAFRRSAQRARAKMVPKIPTEHKDMDPSKVNQTHLISPLSMRIASQSKPTKSSFGQLAHPPM